MHMHTITHLAHGAPCVLCLCNQSRSHRLRAQIIARWSVLRCILKCCVLAREVPLVGVHLRADNRSRYCFVVVIVYAVCMTVSPLPRALISAVTVISSVVTYRIVVECERVCATMTYLSACCV